VARLQLSERELHVLRTGLTSAVEGACIPEWEFEPLIGSTRSRVKRSLEAGLRRIETRGERPSEATCERMLLLLSSLLGASQGQATYELEQLMVRLGSGDRSPLESGVALRGEVVPARAQRR
jgi:hypothetical protein